MGGVYVYPTAGASSVTVSCPAPVPYDAEMAGLGLLMPVPAGYPIPAFGQPVAASTVSPGESKSDCKIHMVFVFL